MDQPTCKTGVLLPTTTPTVLGVMGYPVATTDAELGHPLEAVSLLRARSLSLGHTPRDIDQEGQAWLCQLVRLLGLLQEWSYLEHMNVWGWPRIEYEGRIAEVIEIISQTVLGLRQLGLVVLYDVALEAPSDPITGKGHDLIWGATLHLYQIRKH